MDRQRVKIITKGSRAGTILEMSKRPTEGASAGRFERTCELISHLSRPVFIYRVGMYAWACGASLAGSNNAFELSFVCLSVFESMILEQEVPDMQLYYG